jgi:peptide deformylase
MAILKIAKMGHPILRRVAEPVDDPTRPEMLKLAGDMMETLEDIAGAGLAAPQVHASTRLVMFHVPAERSDDDETVPFTILANPKIEPLGEDTEEGWEGCLSVPGLRGLVRRPANIRYSGYGLDGQRIEREAHGFHARVVQHECDHLDGILYPQRMDDLSKLIFETEFRYHLQEPMP